MIFKSLIPNSFLEKMKLINSYITEQIGGIAEWIEYKDLPIVKIKWKKITDNGHTIYLEQLVSYEELSKIVDPILIAKRFVDHYNERVTQDG